MIETRVRVVESSICSKYYPEYKGKFLFWDCWWDIDTSHGDPQSFRAGLYAESTLGFCKFTKEWAEAVIDKWLELMTKKQEKKLKKEVHKKTQQISYYKYP